MKWNLGFKLNILIAFMIAIIALIGFFNLHSLRNIRESQKKLKTKLEILEKRKKDLDMKTMIYDEKFDLQKIRTNMEKKNMTVANEVIFFELGD